MSFDASRYRLCAVPSNGDSVIFPSVKTIRNRAAAAARIRLPSSDLSEYVLAAAYWGATVHQDAIFDQGGSGSCTAQAVAMAIRTRLFFLAMRTSKSVAESEARCEAIDTPARLPLYQGGRRVTHDDAFDEGTQIQGVLDYAARLGVAPENDPALGLGFADDRVMENVCDDIAVQQAQHDHKLVDGVQRLDAGLSKDELAHEIETCLSMGEPVVGATPVDGPFMHLDGETTYARTKPRIGYHAMALVGHEPGRYKLVNSWSRGWGKGGFALVDKDWLLEEWFDIHRFDVVPDFSKKAARP